MEKAIIYAHGKGGSASEATYYQKFFPKDTIIGVEYSSYLPKQASEEIREVYEEVQRDFDEVQLITNSIGTYFSMLALQDCTLKHAYCISPILDMEKLIMDMMSWANVTEQELTKKKEISTNFGETLSWDYLCFVRQNPIKWTIPTSVLYAQNDNLTKIDTVNEFVKKHNATLTIMPNGEHWFHTPEQLSFLDQWLMKEIKSE